MAYIPKGKASDKVKPPRDVSANTWGKLRSELAKNGYSQQWITEQLGGTVGGRKTAEIMEVLRAAMKTDEAARQREARRPL